MCHSKSKVFKTYDAKTSCSILLTSLTFFKSKIVLQKCQDNVISDKIFDFHLIIVDFTNLFFYFLSVYSLAIINVKYTMYMDIKITNAYLIIVRYCIYFLSIFKKLNL